MLDIIARDYGFSMPDSEPALSASVLIVSGVIAPEFVASDFIAPDDDFGVPDFVPVDCVVSWAKLGAAIAAVASSAAAPASTVKRDFDILDPSS